MTVLQLLKMVEGAIASLPEGNAFTPSAREPLLALAAQLRRLLEDGPS